MHMNVCFNIHMYVYMYLNVFAQTGTISFPVSIYKSADLCKSASVLGTNDHRLKIGVKVSHFGILKCFCFVFLLFAFF